MHKTGNGDPYLWRVPLMHVTIAACHQQVELASQSYTAAHHGLRACYNAESQNISTLKETFAAGQRTISKNPLPNYTSCGTLSVPGSMQRGS